MEIAELETQMKILVDKWLGREPVENILDPNYRQFRIDKIMYLKLKKQLAEKEQTKLTNNDAYENALDINWEKQKEVTN